MERLLVEIEQKREDLLIAVEMYGLSSEKTIELSQELDELLNTYINALKSTSSDNIHIEHNVSQ